MPDAAAISAAAVVDLLRPEGQEAVGAWQDQTQAPLSVRRRQAMLAAAVSVGQVMTPHGVLPVAVTEIDPTPIDPRSLGPQEDNGLIGSDLDRISRAVLWRFTDAERETELAQLALGSRVTVTIETPVVPGLSRLPLTAARQQQAGIAVRGSDMLVPGWRLGVQWLIVESDRKVAATSPVPEQSFPGVLNVRGGSPLVMPAYWGRVRWMQEEGKFVEKGEKILELYNPSLQRQRQ